MTEDAGGARIPILLEVANLAVASASFVASVSAQSPVSVLGAIVLLLDLVMIVGIALLASFGHRYISPSTQRDGAAPQSNRWSRVLGAPGTPTNLLVALIAILMIVVLYMVPVGHVVTTQFAGDVVFADVPPGQTWAHHVSMKSVGEIAFNWTESTAAGSQLPQITVRVTGPGESSYFSQVSMYGQPGNGGLAVAPGVYSISVSQSPDTDTVVHLSVSSVTYSFGPILVI